jgi:hypothetical protein
MTVNPGARRMSRGSDKLLRLRRLCGNDLSSGLAPESQWHCHESERGRERARSAAAFDL